MQLSLHFKMYQYSLFKIFNIITSQKVSKICSYLGFVFSMLFLCCFILYLILKKPNNELDRYAMWLNKLIIFSVILVYLLQIILIGLVWYFKIGVFHMLPNYQNNINIYLLVVCLLLAFFIGIINHKVRIFGIYLIPLIFLIDSSEGLSITSCMLSMLMGAHMINTDQNINFLLLNGHNFRKMIHLTLIGFYKWKFIQHLVKKVETTQNLYISFIYLAFLIVFFIVCGFFKFIYKIDRKSSPVIQLCQCLKNIQKNENDIQSKIFSIEIINDYFRIVQKQKQINEKIYELKNLKYKKWKMQDWHYVVNMMIKQQFQRQPTLQLGINMLECRLMINDKKIYEIIQFLKELISMDKTKSISSKYKILKITLQTHQIYFKKHQTNPHPVAHIIRQMDKLYEKFYHQCCQTVNIIYEFWANVVAYKISMDDDFEDIPLSVFVSEYQFEKLETVSQSRMQKLIQQISLKITRLQDILKKISTISVARQQAKALGCIKFLATYSHESHDDVNHNEFEYQKIDIFATNFHSSPDFSEYFQTIDSKITKISLKLATELGYRKLEIVGENLCFLMPKLYMSDIQNAIITHNQPYLKIPYLVPIICSDNSILLKTMTSHVELDCIHGYRLIYHMMNNLINKDPLIIYNVSCNIIEYYNRVFITTFKIDKTKIDSKIRNKLLSPDQIFKDLQLSDKSIQAKLSEGGLQSQYNCRIQIHDICEKRSVTLENVRLSLIEKQKQYMIFKVMKGFRAKSIVGQGNNEQGKKQLFSTFTLLNNDSSTPLHRVRQKKLRQNSRNNSGDENEIFCKIQNPYQAKINAKKIQLNKQNKITVKFLVVIFLFFAILSLLIEGFVFLEINLQLNQSIKQQSNYNLNAISQYTKLMLAYQAHYKYTLFNLHSDDLYKLGIDLETELNKTGQSIQNYIQQFQQSFLANRDNESQNSFSYKIEYKSFNITTTTSTTNLFDISSNILLYGNNDALNFLIINYDDFSSLANKIFDSLSIPHDNLTFHQNVQFLTSGILIGISLLFLLISTILNYKIQVVRRDIKKIFKLMEKKSMENIFSSLSLIKKKILEIRQSDSNVQRKYKNTIDAYLQTKNLIPIENNKQDKEEIKIDDKSIINEEITPDQKLLNKSNSHEEQNIQIKHSLRCWTIWGYLLVFIALGGANVFQILYFHDRIMMQYQIISFEIENRLISQHLIKEILQTEQVILTDQLVNVINYTASNKVNNVWLVNNQKLPQPYFVNYTKTYFQKISGDLCKILQMTSIVTFSFQECQSVGNGLFSYGLPITIQNTYQILLTSQQQTANYWFHRLSGHKFAVYEQIFMAQQMVIAINQQKEFRLGKYIDDFHKQMNSKAIQLFLLSCALCFCLLLILFKLKCETYKQSSIGIGYFLIIPKKILLENEVLDHIRKKQLLKRICSI